MHKEHRLRVKNRFLAEGFDHFEPHNILEMLLFYAIPQKDTNELAHSLINRFGSLEKVFDASFEELMTVPGIKEHSATLIKMIPSLARVYYVEKNKAGESLANLDAWGQYFVNRYIGIEVETVFLLLLDNKFNIIECAKIHEGCVNSSAISIRKMAEIIFAKTRPWSFLHTIIPRVCPFPLPMIYRQHKRSFALFDRWKSACSHTSSWQVTNTLTF